MAKNALFFSALLATLPGCDSTEPPWPESQDSRFIGNCETAGDVEAGEPFETVSLLQTSVIVPAREGIAAHTKKNERMGRVLPGRMPGGIPRILHQQWGDKPMPEDVVAARASWSRCLGDDWEIMLWNDTSNRELVAKHYPSLLSTFDSYDPVVKQWDAIRRVYMDLYGGVYADVDLECVTSIEPLIQGHSAVLGYAVPRCYLEAAFMASRPGHPFFKRQLEELPFTASLPVADATGCGLLTRSFREYTGNSTFHVVDEPQSFPAVNVSGQENAVTLLGTEHIVWDYCVAYACIDPGSAACSQMRSDYPAASLVNHFMGSWKEPGHDEASVSEKEISNVVGTHLGCYPAGRDCALPKSERFGGWLTKTPLILSESS